MSADKEIDDFIESQVREGAQLASDPSQSRSEPRFGFRHLALSLLLCGLIAAALAWAARQFPDFFDTYVEPTLGFTLATFEVGWWVSTLFVPILVVGFFVYRCVKGPFNYLRSQWRSETTGTLDEKSE